MNDFGQMLRYLRETKGISQAELAKKIGITSAAVGMYEQGKREPDIEKLKKLANYFDVSLDTLLGRSGNGIYYTNKDTAATAQELFDDPDLRVLFDAARDSRPEDLQMAADLLKRLKAANPDG